MMCACIHVCAYIHKYNLLSMDNVMCIFFRDEHLELNNQLECLSQRTIISPTLSVPYLSVVV